MSVPPYVLRMLQRGFIGIGIALLACAGGTAAFAGIYQRYHARQFDREVSAAGVATVARADTEGDLQEGDLVGRIEIPRIGMSVMVLQGVETATLIIGAGHVPGTPLPGGDGNVAIAAHRDTFFRKLEGIQVGDRIDFATVGRTDHYLVESTDIVDPLDTEVMESRARPELTLITCYPFHFVGAAPKRFIVHALPVK